MELAIKVPYPTERKERLSQALGRADDNDRIARLVAAAGAMESLAQATGEAVFSSMSDLRSYRIYCLIAQGMTVSEAEVLVAALFKVPTGSAKTMVAKAVARYSVELQSAVRSGLVDMVDAATWHKSSEKWRLDMPSKFMRDLVMDILSRKDVPTPTAVQRGSTWSLDTETLNAIRSELGLDEVKAP